MERQHDHLRTYRSLELYVPSAVQSSNNIPKQRPVWPTMSASSLRSSWTSTSGTKSKHRRSHYGYRIGQQDFRPFHLQRQFSEDSGFSSCSSSASSVADESESLAGSSLFCPKSKHCLKQYSWNKVPSRNHGPQSGTVASVLAAGVSDSEETDQCESDDEGSDGVFGNCGKVQSDIQFEFSHKPRFSPLKSSSAMLQIKKFLQHVAGEDKPKLKHFGRDILDLGTNIITQFPLKASVLPEKNLPIFLQNRSQYHRLGKFGAAETLRFVSCTKQCGFSFPVPPSEGKCSSKVSCIKNT